MRYLLIILLAVCLGSCGAKKEVTVSEKTETVKDSTYTTRKIVPKDTLVTVPADSIKVSVPLEDLSDEPIVRSTGRTTARVSLVDNQVEVECLTEEYEQIIEIQNEVITTLREYIKTTNSQTTTTITKTPWYMRLWNSIGSFAILILLAIVGIKFIKPF